VLNQPFFQITLPLIVTFVSTVWAATWMQNKRLEEMAKRFDDRLGEMSKRLDDIVARLGRIESLLGDQDRRITTLETAKWR